MVQEVHAVEDVQVQVSHPVAQEAQGHTIISWPVGNAAPTQTPQCALKSPPSRATVLILAAEINPKHILVP